MDIFSPIRFLKKKRYLSLIRLFKFDKDPLIIGGCGRSGTTLLLSILSSHPEIQPIDFEAKIFDRPRSGMFFHLKNLLRVWFILVGRDVKPNARFWCEKTPRNVNYFEEILNEFSGKVKLIHIVRDGRDVVLSKHPHTKGYHVEPSRWVNDVNNGLSFRGNPNYLEVRYEELIENYESAVAKILAFLEIDYHPNLSEFSKHSKVLKHSAWKGEVKPIFKTSINKWQMSENEARIKEFYQYPGTKDLLGKLGYKIG